MCRRLVYSLVFLLILVLRPNGFAAQESEIKPLPVTPLGNLKAPKGGTIYLSLSTEPEKLNPLTSTDVGATVIQNWAIEGLLSMNSETYEWEPGLATTFESDKDGMWYIFHLRKDAKWSDGKPVTVEDVKFSFDVIFNDAYSMARSRPYFENIEKAEVIGPHSIKFSIKKKYFNNFNVLGSGGFMAIVPKHVYGNPKKKNNKKLVGSGPFIVEKYKRGKSITLVRNKHWWGYKDANMRSQYNFDKIFYRFIKEENTRLDYLKKGKIDIDSLTPEAFMQKTKGKVWSTKLKKQKVKNLTPKGYAFVAWNLNNKLFKDRKVRRALTHLMNRRLMNQKFRFGMSLLATGPNYQQNPFSDPTVKPLEFNPKQAQKLLKKAGWADTDKDGVLDKVIDGQKVPFQFSLILANRDTEKYYTLYKQDLKKAGIQMQLKLVEWNSLVKALDERKFEAVTLGWGGGSIEWEPKQIWHSDAAKKGGSNFIGYKNSKVDALIDRGRGQLDRKERIKTFQKVYRLIAEDAPYTFMFNDQFALYAHSNRMGMEKPTYKYGIGQNYWWLKAGN